ncbi:polysaccharide deacetylase family protein [Mucilaginibacter conchicola]|nr:polysaccharide deacetylase family protein [Mucilaginibacter conchicola]
MMLLLRVGLMFPPQIPVLCYHQIRDWKPKDKARDKEYIMPPATFRKRLKMLADSGYHTILPDELYAHLTKGTPLPSKPVMLTFDDTDGDQYHIARPEMAKYGFKGVYFIVFNNINKNRAYMNRSQIRQLSDEGHVIGSHTLNHPNIKKLKDSDWVNELDVSARKLETLTGKPVKYFAYPFGIWDQRVLPQLDKYGYLAAFQLDQPRDAAKPLLTVRRVIDDGRWDNTTLNRYLQRGFGRR